MTRLRRAKTWGFIGVCASALGLGAILSGCKSPAPSETAEYRYDKPLLSPGAQFAALPPAVQNTVRAETGAAEIANIEKDTRYRRVIYHVYFANHQRYAPLNIAADGSLLDQDMMVVAAGAPVDKPNVITGGPVSGITLNDLPTPVVKAIQRQAPDAEVDTILKEVHKDQTSYVITFKDHMHSTLHLASDGTAL